MVPMFVVSAGLSLQLCSRNGEHRLKRCILRLEALLLLLLRETAAQAAGSRQECEQSLNGERFIALVGSYSGLFLRP